MPGSQGHSVPSALEEQSLATTARRQSAVTDPIGNSVPAPGVCSRTLGSWPQKASVKIGGLCIIGVASASRNGLPARFVWHNGMIAAALTMPKIVALTPSEVALA